MDYVIIVLTNIITGSFRVAHTGLAVRMVEKPDGTLVTFCASILLLTRT